VCEVNSSPGFKGLESAHPNLNVADMILQYAELRQGVFRQLTPPHAADTPSESDAP
jgi:hypothetical protein